MIIIDVGNIKPIDFKGLEEEINDLLYQIKMVGNIRD